MTRIDGLGAVLDFIRGLPPKVQAQIARKIFALADDPSPADSKALHGYTDLERVDSGEYRIVYRLDSHTDTIEIILVEKRNDDQVYRRLKRLME